MSLSGVRKVVYPKNKTVWKMRAARWVPVFAFCYVNCLSHYIYIMHFNQYIYYNILMLVARRCHPLPPLVVSFLDVSGAFWCASCACTGFFSGKGTQEWVPKRPQFPLAYTTAHLWRQCLGSQRMSKTPIYRDRMRQDETWDIVQSEWTRRFEVRRCSKLSKQLSKTLQIFILGMQNVPSHITARPEALTLEVSKSWHRHLHSATVPKSQRGDRRFIWRF